MTSQPTYCERLFIECARWQISSQEFKALQCGETILLPNQKNQVFTCQITNIKGKRVACVLLQKMSHEVIQCADDAENCFSNS